ncbi:uncharacterized protein [Mytilus edulis]|uniref:uncharacterized protein n=1 Tax=Mytilus edulis TaxID=6550 RepID=UPI0039EEACF4
MGSVISCCCCNDSIEDDDLRQTDKNILDLEKLVKKRAWALYQEHTRRCLPRKREKLDLVLDWSRVKFIPDEPIFNEFNVTGKDADAVHIIFKTVFENKSKVQQQHTLRAERQTVSSCKSCLTKGYTMGFNVELSLSAPDDIANAAVGYSKGFSLENAIENSEEKSLTWVAEGCLNVPQTSTITASMQIKERQREFSFETWVAVKGIVKGTFYNQKKQSMYTCTLNMRTIIFEEIPKEMRKKVNEIYYIKIEGKCKFKYGIEQEIKISE